MRKLLFLLSVLLLVAGCGKHKTDAVRLQRGDTLYIGMLKDSLPEGMGELRVKGKMVYSGGWKAGKRDGKALSRDTLGNLITGRWRSGKLVSGTKADSLGRYTGELNAAGFPNGYGIHRGIAGDYYQGMWAGGERNGLGFAINATGKLRLGEWKADRYRGERLEYTTQRIYGIDLSRFQHDVGRHRYSIDWTKLRIINLGTLSKKRIRGRVDYPVRFCFIKSTEGTTVRNRYFRRDYEAARRRGIHCGAYHFFSTTSPALKQARHFLRRSIFRKGDLPPVLDLEPSNAQIRRMGGAGKLFAEVRVWLRAVEKQVGVKPILYISQSFVNRYLPQAPDLERDYQVWIARYGEYKPDIHLAIWQLSPDGRVSGIRTEVDINVFNGYESQFQNFLQTQCIK